MSRSVIRVLVFALGVCSAALQAGCARQVVSRNIQSPDGKLTLRIEVNEGGGAAVPDVTRAFILPSEGSVAHKELIFKGSAMSYFNATWTNSSAVTLSIEGGYITKCNPSAVLPPNVRIAVIGCK